MLELRAEGACGARPRARQGSVTLCPHGMLRESSEGGNSLIDKFTVPLLTPLEAAEHLQIPERTMHRWLHKRAAGRPLVHSIRPERRGWPSVPFVALVEAYVLRALRSYHLPTSKIQAAAADIRKQFGPRRPIGLLQMQGAIHDSVRRGRGASS